MISLSSDLARHVLHHQVVGAILVRDIVQCDDVGMIQRGGRAGFLQEAPLALRIGDLIGRKNLDSDVAMQAGIARAIHFGS